MDTNTTRDALDRLTKAARAFADSTSEDDNVMAVDVELNAALAQADAALAAPAAEAA